MVSKFQRWSQLSQYYLNRWHYDGTKWAERIWYGNKPSNTTGSIASVPFMITKKMRFDLEEAGFPDRVISTLPPAMAHQILTNGLLYTEYERQIQQIQVNNSKEEKYPISPDNQSHALQVVELPEDMEGDNIETKEK